MSAVPSRAFDASRRPGRTGRSPDGLSPAQRIQARRDAPRAPRRDRGLPRGRPRLRRDGGPGRRGLRRGARRLHGRGPAMALRARLHGRHDRAGRLCGGAQGGPDRAGAPDGGDPGRPREGGGAGRPVHPQGLPLQGRHGGALRGGGALLPGQRHPLHRGGAERQRRGRQRPLPVARRGGAAGDPRGPGRLRRARPPRRQPPRGGSRPRTRAAPCSTAIAGTGPRGLLWTGARLWDRLRSPAPATALHATGDLLLVSAPRRDRRAAHTLLCALLPRPGARPGRREVAAAVSAACRMHRRPVFVYAGINDAVPLPGLLLPARYRPSPMILQMRDFAPGPDGRAAARPVPLRGARLRLRVTARVSPVRRDLRSATPAAPLSRDGGALGGSGPEPGPCPDRRLRG